MLAKKYIGVLNLEDGSLVSKKFMDYIWRLERLPRGHQIGLHP
jgi:hypothetical protein